MEWKGTSICSNNIYPLCLQKENCHHVSSLRWPRQDEPLHIYMKFHFSQTSFKDGRKYILSKKECISDVNRGVRRNFVSLDQLLSPEKKHVFQIEVSLANFPFSLTLKKLICP